MALWVFGCSFSVHEGAYPEVNYPSWTHILASRLGFDEYHNLAQWGVSNEYIIDKFMTSHTSFAPGDYIILQLTHPARQWFFKDKPELGNFYIKDLEKSLTKSQKKAIDLYITQLDSDESQVIRYALTCMAIKHITSVLDWCKIMVLPGFNHVSGVNGSLLEVCDGEFVSDESREQWYKAHPVDIRINHLSEPNHHILADKIHNTFNTGYVLDLTQGFETGFL